MICQLELSDMSSKQACPVEKKTMQYANGDINNEDLL